MTAPELPSLKTGFAWTLAGNFLYGACQWGMLVVLAKLGTTQSVGQFALGLAIAGPILFTANLQLRAFQATDAGGEYSFGDYLAVRITTSALSFLIILGIALSARYDRDTFVVIVLVALAKTFESLSDVLFGLLQRHERFERVSRSLIMKGVGSLAAVWLAMTLTGSVVMATGALALVWGAVLAGYDLRSAFAVLRDTARLKPRWDRARMTRLIATAAPLGGASGIGSLRANVPRYFIDSSLGHAALGIFAAMAYAIVLGGRFVVSVGQTVSARLGRYSVQRDVIAFRRTAIRLALLAVAVGGLGVGVAALAGRWVLTMLYQPEYAQHIGAFILVMAAGACEYLNDLMQIVLTSARWVRIQAVLVVISLAIVAIVSAVAVGRWGLAGGALAWAAGAGVEAAGNSIAVLLVLRRMRATARRPGPA